MTPKNVILAYGAGGIGKSRLLSTAAAWMWKTQGKKTRIVNADGGGTEKAFQPLIERGIAEIWNVDQWDEKSYFVALDQACLGYWPENVLAPNCPLVPGGKVVRLCNVCGKDSGAGPLTLVVAQCAACKAVFPKGTVLEAMLQPINGMEEVGFVGFEGMTAFGNLLLNSLRKGQADGRYQVKVDGFVATGLGQADWGLAQMYISQMVASSRRIPTELVMWTALESRGEDEGKPLYGPKGPGKALTSVCIPWFTDVLHLDAFPQRNAQGMVQRDASGVELLDRKMFLAAHFPPDNPLHKFAAKTSSPEMPPVMKPDMREYFKELEGAFDKAAKLLLE